MAGAGARRARRDRFAGRQTSFERLDDAADVADRTGRSGRAVGYVVEGLNGDIAGIGMAPERRDERREALLALSRTLAVAVVDLHVRDDTLGQPAVDERAERLLL